MNRTNINYLRNIYLPIDINVFHKNIIQIFPNYLTPHLTLAQKQPPIEDLYNELTQEQKKIIYNKMDNIDIITNNIINWGWFNLLPKKYYPYSILTLDAFQSMPDEQLIAYYLDMMNGISHNVKYYVFKYYQFNFFIKCINLPKDVLMIIINYL